MTRATFSYFAILGIMRTGSNLLEQTLNQFPKLHCFGELFNPGFIGHEGVSQLGNITLAQRDAAPLDLLTTVQQQQPDSIPGFRIFPDHDTRVLDQVLKDPNCGKIILRRNHIDSYLSLKIAQQTGQWRLGGIAARKSAQVEFVPQDYEDYCRTAEKHYHTIEHHLRAAGQTAFRLNYDDVLDAQTIHGAALYLGDDTQLESLKTTTKRQNPESYAEKVVNFDAFQAYFGDTKSGNVQANAFAPTRFDFQKTIAIDEASTLYIPLPGLERGTVDDALKTLGKPNRQKSATDIANWTQAQPAPRIFTVIDDPLARAYRTFWTHIMPGPHSFKNISTRLADNFDVTPLQPSASIAEIQTSFSAFLTFLKANMHGQTAIRIADAWDCQSSLIERINADVCLTAIVRKSQVAAFLDTPMHSATDLPQGAAPLSDIETADMRTMAHGIYAKDYQRFGQTF